MKNSRIVAIVIAVMNIILIAVCIIFYIRADRVSPEFKFQLSSLIYTEDMDKAELLRDITAHDNKDGDITEHIVIEKIVENRSESSIVVFYAASDKAGNVSKISRVFPASLPEEENETAEETDISQDSVVNGNEEGDISSEVPGIEEMEESSEDVEEESEEEAGEDSSMAEEEEDTEAEGNSVDTEEASVDAEEDSTDDEETAENTMTDNREAENSRADSREAENSVSEEERPVIMLKTTEVTTRAGVAPAWVEVIGSLKDDKDNYETLFYNLSVSKYDLNKAGTYKVALTTKDSDGNVSDPVTLTVNVK